jgi:hypothetical protein
MKASLASMLTMIASSSVSTRRPTKFKKHSHTEEYNQHMKSKKSKRKAIKASKKRNR